MSQAALAVLLSAFLLFLVQPLMGRLVMPLFGGGAPIWTTCLVFFQSALVLGYAYALLSTRWLPARWQRVLHVLLLLVSIAWLHLAAPPAWQPIDGAEPQLRIARLLLLTVGAPFVLLAASGPLAQSWLAHAGVSPWRLFAVSNLASIAALIAYPLLVEPMLGLHLQVWVWGALYVAAAALVARLAWLTREAASPEDANPLQLQLARISSGPVVWMTLAALPAGLLVATTDTMTRDLPAIPLLWIGPLALYLFSFVAWFDGRLQYHRAFWMACASLAVLVLVRVVTTGHYDFEPLIAVPLLSTGLFAICLFCHGELAQLRPDAQRLGLYYLCLAAGGAGGGALVSLAAPRVLADFYDMAILIAGLALPLGLAARRLDRRLLRLAGAACAALAVLAGLYGVAHRYLANRRDTVSVQRNFYGTLRVVDQGKDTPDSVRLLWHGGIIHGLQYLDPARRREPTEYYREQSGVGLAIAALGEGPRRMGLVGLGAGTLAAYGRAGDELVFYEINPLVERVARRDFTFLADSPATVSVVSGDARLSLRREAPRGYDLLALDAFSGNALPLHLLTVEAFGVYVAQVKENGLIAINVSNKFFDLVPLVAAAAAAYGWHAGLVVDELVSDWMVLAKDDERLRRSPLGPALRPAPPAPGGPWTDDRLDILRALARSAD